MNKSAKSAASNISVMLIKEGQMENYLKELGFNG